MLELCLFSLFTAYLSEFLFVGCEKRNSFMGLMRGVAVCAWWVV